MNTNYPVTRGISVYSWAITVILDLVWGSFEGLSLFSFWGIILIPFAMIMLFSICFLSVTAVQHLHVGESLGAAMKKGLLLGLVAAIPLPFTLIAFAALRGQASLDRETIYLGQLTREWRDLEAVLKRGVPYEIRDQGIQKVIENLYATGRISRAEWSELHELRAQRNTAVHYASSVDLPELARRIRRMRSRLGWRLR